jgi:hypothetical protein
MRRQTAQRRLRFSSGQPHQQIPRRILLKFNADLRQFRRHNRPQLLFPPGRCGNRQQFLQ